MSTEGIERLLQRLFHTQQGLREIDGPLSVPWTATQWMLWTTVCALRLVAVLRLYRYLQRWWANRQITFTSLRRELDEIDQARLRRQLEYDEVILAIADGLRSALRLADRQRGGSGGYRTTGQWVSWSAQHLPTDQQKTIQAVLRLADDLKFSQGQSSLSEVRMAITAVRELLTAWRDASPAGTELGPEQEDAA
jgi:hypothetical protein